MENKDKVIDRVRKMLNLANNAAATEGERDNAMRMAHATLAKYNLSLGDAEEKQEKRVDSSIEISPHAWARSAIMAVAKLYFCDYFFCRKHNGKIQHYFVGRESNVVTAQEMAVYIIKSIGKEARKRTKDALEDGKFERDFCKGAAVSVLVRCRKIRAEAEKGEMAEQASTGTALVLSSLYKQEREANALVIAAKYGPLTVKESNQTAAGANAYGQGRDYGNKINLNKQVSQSRSASTFLN